MDSFTEWLRIGQVVLGIGLVIFVHEAGHFLAARLCKVRVEVFSLGFGPRLFGWRRGHTLYQIAAVPIGGFVKMAGDELERPRDTPPREWELGSKSVPARFFIFSGGVLMNIAFALVVFPFVLASGLPSVRPLVGNLAPGSPAWHARFPVGATILEVNGKGVFDFYNIPNEVALSGSDPATFRVQVPGEDGPRDITLTPTYVEDPGVYQVGIGPSYDPELPVVVSPDTPASRAGMRDGDRVLSVDGGLQGLSVAEQLQMALRDGQTLGLQVQRDGEPVALRIEPEVRQVEDEHLFGVEVAQIRLSDIRKGGLAAELDLRKDDRIHAVGDQPVLRRDEIVRALVERAGRASEFTLERDGREVHVPLPPMSVEQVLGFTSDLAITPDLENTLVAVTPGGGAAAAGMLDGDRITSIDDVHVEDWQAFRKIAKRLSSSQVPVPVSVLRVDPSTGQSQVLQLGVEPTVRSRLLWGFNLLQADYIYQTTGVAESISIGVAASWRFLAEAGRVLRRMLTREVSTENLGGIITIGVVSHSFASQGLAKLFFFLCMLSMNLALLNVLPIPVLDGGHLFFLLVEGIKGSPVSERTLGYSQIVGLVLILSLMVYVTYNDVARWFFPAS